MRRRRNSVKRSSTFLPDLNATMDKIAENRAVATFKQFFSTLFAAILQQSYKICLVGLYFAGLKSGMNLHHVIFDIFLSHLI